MARVTEAQVTAILDTDLDDLSPFITAASLVVDRVAAADSTLAAADLLEIERWLAAHFAAIRDERAHSQRQGDSSVTYQGKTGKGLEFTSYGQQAMALDPTGILRTLGKPRASLTSIGRAADGGEMKER